MPVTKCKICGNNFIKIPQTTAHGRAANKILISKTSEVTISSF